ncbi:MAG: dihydrofolate reductase family protein [Desulfocapsaceae bacterium]|nr:dihydrofolate reductase family protein [Desulfocapsaceae bacterium]
MRKLAILTFITLDGVMQAPSVPEEDYSGGFTQGGWARDYWEDVMEQVSREAMAENYDLLLGRNTYETFASAFGNSGNNDPIAKKLNNAMKFVVTSTMKDLQWKNSERITGDIAAEVFRLKQQDGPLLQVHGSWQLIQTLLSYKLIDEYRLWTFPVVVGSGKRLFASGAIPTDLKLIKSESCASGAIMSFYQPVEGDAK